MGNVLKSEFYKLTHSKKYCVFYGIAIVLWLATFISRMIAKTDSGWLVGLTAGGAFGWDMFVAVFAVVYILDDFKNGYLKNIYFYLFGLSRWKRPSNGIGTSTKKMFFRGFCPKAVHGTRWSSAQAPIFY